MGKVLYPELSYLIYGLCYKIHNELGRYRNEKQYADDFENLLKNNRNIPDFVVEDKIVVDFKAKRIITKEDYYQMKRYLVSSNKALGLIVNFREYYLKPKRILNSNNLYY